MSKLGKSLLQGAKEALAYARKEKTKHEHTKFAYQKPSMRKQYEQNYI